LNTIKVIFTGAAQTGKTALLKRYINNETVSTYKMTIGMDIFSKRINKMNTNFTFQFVEIAGRRQFDFMRKGQYRGASIVGLVVDVSRRETLQRAREIFVSEILPWIQNSLNKNKKVILILNKIDLDQREISKNDILRFINYMSQLIGNKVSYFEASALNNIGIEELFEHITNIVNTN